jgi:FPC/CPF motif-containing protein YcgG
VPSWQWGEFVIDRTLTADQELLFDMKSDPPIPWAADAFNQFRTRMLDDRNLFPCIFGVDAVRRNTLRLAAIPSGPERVDVLADALRAFVPQCRQLGTRTSLVTIFEPDPDVRTLTGYRHLFWQLLQGLHDQDQVGWPAGIAIDPSSPTWEFSFHGEPMFVVANSPAHVRRRSRFFEYFAITFQPRFVFDDLGADSVQGRNARRIIRGRLADYDLAPQSPNLGSFGTPDNREWSQYFFDDTDDGFDPAARCPFHTRAQADERSVSS